MDAEYIAPDGQRVTLAATDEEERLEAIETWRERMQAIIGVLRHRYAYGAFVAKAMLDDLERWTRFAETGATLDTASITQRDAFARLARALGGMRDWVIAHPDEVFPATSTFVRTFLAQAEQAAALFVATGTPILRQYTSDRAAWQAVKDAPGKLAHYSLEQLLAALGIPKWMLPVMGVTLVAGFGVWAYFSFIAPARAVSRRALAGASCR